MTRVNEFRKEPIKLDPNNDGVTHINIYSRSNSPLGKFLSNFEYTPFKHPVYGNFDSVEGFWYYIATGCKHDELRKLYGTSAKTYGKSLIRVEIPNFHEIIKSAIECKIEQHPIMKAKLLFNKLPLTHYFVFKGGVVVDQPRFAWQVRFIEELVTLWRNA